MKNLPHISTVICLLLVTVLNIAYGQKEAIEDAIKQNRRASGYYIALCKQGLNESDIREYCKKNNLLVGFMQKETVANGKSVITFFEFKAPPPVKAPEPEDLITYIKDISKYHVNNPQGEQGATVFVGRDLEGSKKFQNFFGFPFNGNWKTNKKIENGDKLDGYGELVDHWDDENKEVGYSVSFLGTFKNGLAEGYGKLNLTSGYYKPELIRYGEWKNGLFLGKLLYNKKG